MSGSNYKVGMVVRHKLSQEWGLGEIVKVNGNIITINFDKVGKKDFDSTIAPLEIVEYRKAATCDSLSDSEKAKIEADANYFAKPDKIYSLKELRKKGLPASSSGVYGWYFKKTPLYVPTKSCPPKRGKFKKWKLLYIGLASNLKDRIVNMHFNGNADSSSFRLSLGCLLTKKLKVFLRTDGQGRYTFGRKGEKKLSKWMVKYARVEYRVSEHYEQVEKRAISIYKSPLNTEKNPCPFIPLKRLKSDIKDSAKLSGSKPTKRRIRKAYKKFVKECKRLGIKK